MRFEEVTPEHFANWKAKFMAIRRVDVLFTPYVFSYIICVPTYERLARVESMCGVPENIQEAEEIHNTLFDACILAGDIEHLKTEWSSAKKVLAEIRDMIKEYIIDANPINN